MNRYKIYWHDAQGVLREYYTVADSLEQARSEAIAQHGEAALFSVESA